MLDGRVAFFDPTSRRVPNQASSSQTLHLPPDVTERELEFAGEVLRSSAGDTARASAILKREGFTELDLAVAFAYAGANPARSSSTRTARGSGKHSSVDSA